MTPTRRDIVHACELLDGETSALYIEALDEPARRALGVGLLRRDGALAAWATGVDALSFNRVVGLGIETPATPAALDALIEPFVAAGVRRFMVQVCPDARPAGMRTWLKAREFQHHNNWVKLWRDVSPVEARTSDVRIERIGRERAADFARVFGAGFGFPDSVASWSAAGVGLPAWHHYLALAGETPVATGALFVRGEAGWLGMAATLAEHRGRGAQSALIARRVEDAASLGCRFVVVETAEETQAKPAPSYRNVTRLGFAVAYLRPNFVKVLREA